MASCTTTRISTSLMMGEEPGTTGPVDTVRSVYNIHCQWILSGLYIIYTASGYCQVCIYTARAMHNTNATDLKQLSSELKQICLKPIVYKCKNH